jgi:hypothetical protein
MKSSSLGNSYCKTSHETLVILLPSRRATTAGFQCFIPSPTKQEYRCTGPPIHSVRAIPRQQVPHVAIKSSSLGNSYCKTSHEVLVILLPSRRATAGFQRFIPSVVTVMSGSGAAGIEN